MGDGYTYPAENPHARLDYVLHSIDVVTCIAAVLSTDGSDHLPVAADLALPGDRMGAGSVGRPADGWSDRSTVEARMAAAEPSGEPP